MDAIGPTQTATLPLKAAYAFGAANGLANDIAAIRDLEIEWESSYDSSLRRGYIVELFQRHSIFEEFKKQHWHAGNTPRGERWTRRFLKIKKAYENFQAGRPAIVGDESEDEDIEAFESSPEFPYEEDLKNYLAKNLQVIERGLQVYEKNGITGIEYPVGGRFIDILAVDRDGGFVVVELKVSKGYEKTIGQLLRYMGWVQKNLAAGARVRGVIVANEINEDLKLAASLMPDVKLAEYEISFTLKPLCD
jgi:hypothetical protein